MKRQACLLALLCALSACGGGSHRAVVSASGYQAPGPPEDPWGPYINQAATRFDVPHQWIRAVIRQETGGREYRNGQPITSDAGAMGLMQLMPATYGELAARYGLGPDPYEPHDNIMAGTAYISELYARYGSPAFLAAYDAGPHRLETYLAGRGTLPNETVNYLASAAPNLGTERPMTGPLAAFADTGGVAPPAPVPHAYAAPRVASCWQDPNAAYDPDAPCRPAPPVQPAEAAPPVQPAEAAPPPPPPQRRYAGNFLIPSAAAATVQPAMATGGWGIQVGAFASADIARRIAESVRVLSPRELGSARAVLGTTDPFGGRILYRARLLGLSAGAASAACGNLRTRAQACVTVPPGA